MNASWRGFMLAELGLGLALGLSLLLALQRLHAGVQRSDLSRQRLLGMQRQQAVIWHAIDTSLLQRGGADLPPQWLRLPLPLQFAAGQALAAARLGDGSPVLFVRQWHDAGARATDCLGGDGSRRAAGARIAVDAYYVRDGAWLCQPLASADTGLTLQAVAAAQALAGSATDPLLLGWELEWGLATASGWRVERNLSGRDWALVRSLRVSLQLRGADGVVRHPARVFAVLP